MDRFGVRVVLFVVVVGLVVGVVGVGAGGEYSLSVSESVSVPEQTVTHEGQTYTFSSIGSVDAGDAFTVSATAPDGATYQVQLRNNEHGIEDVENGEGSDSVTFDRSYAPGSYVLALEDGTFKAIQPVVVNAYDVSVDHDEESAPDETVTVTATLSDIEPVSYDYVELIIWDGSSSDDFTMDASGDSYETTISGLDEGSYQLYVTVRGSDTIDGSSEREILALSDSSTLQVSEPAEESDDNGGSTSPPPASSPPQTATPTPTPTETNETGTPVNETNETMTPTPTETNETPTPEPTPTVTPEEPSTPTETATPTPTMTPAETPTETSDDSVITPAPETATPTVTDGQALYGMHLLALILALVGAAYRLRRW